MAGYQGWFMTAGDGSGMGWWHWAATTPTPDNAHFDLWPDLREYAPDELTDTEFEYASGDSAGLYSAYNPTTVARHVEWMKDYGIDGVFVQRFLLEAVRHTAVRDRVLDNVRVASEQHGRVFATMYDISGADETTLVEDLERDWMHLVYDEGVTGSARYLHHEGRPVVAIWGVGVGDRPGTPVQATELLDWFHSAAPERYRATILGGVDPRWRSHSTDWLDVYHRLDILSPWAVGRFADDSGADTFRSQRIEPDLEDTASRGIDYLPVVFPGFSWHNLKGGSAALNQIPRRGGRFYWRQSYNAVDAGCAMLYVAMFDEVDEGTAMFKVAEDASQLPTLGSFVTLDADGERPSSDFYLRLMAASARMLRGEIELSPSIPITAFGP